MKSGFKVSRYPYRPRDGFIEIGITPYSEEYAGYLYGIFGSDMVKVVEGQQAVTLPLAAGEPDVEVDALTAVDNAAVGDPEVRLGLTARCFPLTSILQKTTVF